MAEDYEVISDFDGVRHIRVNPSSGKWVRDTATDAEFFPFRIVDVKHVPTEVTDKGVWCRIETTDVPGEGEEK